MTEKTDIKSMNLSELTDYVVSLGEKRFRAGQIYQWMHEKLAVSIEDMSNLSKTFREKLKEECIYTVLEQADVQMSKDGTRKYLFRLWDGNVIESVLMRYKFGNSVCISSQAGCRMGCRFCASTLEGLVRNLTPAEMLEQVYQIVRDTRERVSHVVVMGTGEPLDNFDSLLRFIELLTGERGMNLSQRNITVSTCGIVPKIKELAEKKLQITLALSLHAPTQEKRRELMPIANKYELDDVMDACREYVRETGRRITFEYSLTAGINDSPGDASELSSLIKGINCHVNLIPVNPIKERDYRKPGAEDVREFKNKLEKYGINVTIRREMGQDIDGACGQLRRKYMERQG